MGNALSKSMKKTKTKPDHFIVKYSGSNKNKIDDISLLDQRRVIFVSLIGLFTTWNDCPSFVLYSAIFVLPLKRRWIYTPKKFMLEIKRTILYKYTSFFQDDKRFHKFIELLKWKDNQELVFWMLDDLSIKSIKNKINPSVEPIWYYLSNKLTHLYDPLKKGYYKPLHFDADWWENNYISLYNVKLSYILNEYYFLTMNFKSIQEILHQSNPKSFNIIIGYNTNYTCSHNNRMIKTSSIKSMFGTNSHHDNENSEWFISDDYDPSDM